jgi:hypothetical protein
MTRIIERRLASERARADSPVRVARGAGGAGAARGGWASIRGLERATTDRQARLGARRTSDGWNRQRLAGPARLAELAEQRRQDRPRLKGQARLAALAAALSE